jgi:hypothetical protein
MSGTFPTSPKPTEVSVSSTSPTLLDMTHSGRRNARQLGAQKWALECAFPSTMNRDQFMPLFAFALSQAGRFGVFSFVSPDLATPRGTAGGTPRVDGGSQTGTNVNTDGWTPNTGVLKAGDILKYASHNKVYMMTEDADANGSGDATLVHYPPLMEAIANNELITVIDVPFTVQLLEDVSKYVVRGPLLYNFKMSMLEVI